MYPVSRIGLADDLGHRLALLGGHRRAGRLLDDLLVAALKRALAFAEGPDAAVLVGEYLELDVPGTLDDTPRSRRRGS